MAFTTKASIASFGGKLLKLSHASPTTGTDMAVSVFLPPQAVVEGKKVPVLIYLSGLTCSPDNCSEKGFFQHGAARHGVAVVYPDTSPRGLGLPGEKDSWDFGEAASFYVDAARDPFAKNYRMETYLTRELPGLLFDAFPGELDRDRVSITGHSMGGHGALTLYLKHPDLYKSVSAFAPIANPSKCPWGEKAFTGYLGAYRAAWAQYDATELVKAGHKASNGILIDQGTADKFLAEQLKPDLLVLACRGAGQAIELNKREGYDHGYFFIQTFIASHLEWHASRLEAG